MTFRRTEDVTVVIPTVPPRDELRVRALNSVESQSVECGLAIQMDWDGLGPAATRNTALEQVTTEWVAFLDDDDELDPDHIESCLAMARLSGADLVYPWFRVVGGTDPLGVPVEGQLRNPYGVSFGPEQRDHLLARANFIPVTVLVRTHLVLRAGGFQLPSQANSRHCEDWGLWQALLREGAVFAHLPRRTWTWHHDGHHYSGRSWRADAVQQH